MFSHVIDGTHWFVPKEELRIPLAQLKTRTTVYPRFSEEAFPMWVENDKYFGIPRFYQNVGNLADTIIDARTDGLSVSFNMRNEPRPKQVPVLQEFVDALVAGYTGFSIDMATGGGKTFVAINMLQKLGKTALIVVPRDHIVDQWIDRILEHTDLTRDDIGIARQSKCEWKGKKIVVGMMHSLAKDKYPEEFKNYFGVLVIDEVHTTATEHFSTVMTLYPARIRIGLSATHARKDGADKAIKWSLGEKTIILPGGVDVSSNVFIYNYKAAYVDHPYLDKITGVSQRRGIILSMLAADMTRNAILARYTHKFVESGRRTVFLSDRVEQLETIKRILEKTYNVHPKDIGIFISTTKKSDRKRILDECKYVLATYGVMKMAVDAPGLKGLVFGTPMADIEQAVGRISRLCEGTMQPSIFDLVDEAYPDCVKWGAAREVAYTGKRLNANVLRIAK